MVPLTSPLASAAAPSAVAGAWGGPAFIPFRFPGLPRVSCLFTTAHAGNLSLDGKRPREEQRHIMEARERLVRSCNLGAWGECRQMHQTAMQLDIEPVDWRRAPVVEADGASTCRARLALVIKTADCQPILLAHRSGGCIAALHVGWRGNALEFILSAVAAFCRKHGVRPEDLYAVRGPSLGPAAAEFINFSREWPPAFAPWLSPSTRTMDLWALTRHQLVQAGLPPEHIFSLDMCTHTMAPLFFSYRRGHTGRQLSLIWIEGE